MVPVMQFWRAYQHTQGSNGQTHVGMNVDGPNPAKRKQSGEGLQRKSHHKCRQVDQADGVDAIERMFPMGRQPVEMFGAVMNGMETPQKSNPVLQAMSPLDQRVA